MNSRTYCSWHMMMQRCRNPNHDKYKYYGGRGIKVCDDWMSFENFLVDMGIRPDDMTLDRINNNGDYELSNCRWADKYTQANNTKKNRFIEYQGERLTYAQWGRKLGICRIKIGKRIRNGWSAKEALTESTRKRL